MRQQLPTARAWASVFFILATVCSIAANVVMARMLERSLTAGERLVDTSGDLLASNTALLAADTQLKKDMEALEAQVNICLDRKTRRASLVLEIGR